VLGVHHRARYRNHKLITDTYSETNPARAGSLEVSALIIGCADIRASGFSKDKPLTKFREWFQCSIMALAAQNLCLKAHELGLGTSSWG
jgi:nitroreductase